MNRTIHYIWLGGNPKSKLIEKCIKSWRLKMPKWEIKEWNESNLDLDINKYCRQAYDAGKYAFASDVLRFYILSRYGGLYMDVDVEILENFDDLTQKYEAFSGFEFNKITVAPGLVLYSKKPHNIVIDKMLELYMDREFDGDNHVPKTVCEYMTEMLVKEGMKANNELQTIGDFTVFPATYFCPTNNIWSAQLFSENTKTIHHYNASWLIKGRKKETILRLCCKSFGAPGVEFVKKFRNNFLK